MPTPFSAPAYDGRNRLASWTPTNDAPRYFTYDPLGNLTGHGVPSPSETNQDFDPAHPHRVVSSGPDHTFSYDDDGNLASQTAAGFHTTYAFDSQNRLVCRGGCQDYQATYDLSGTRLHDRTVMTNRFYLDDWFTYEALPESDPVATVHIFAFGEEIARKTGPVTLRTADAWPGLGPLRDLLPRAPLAAGLAAGAACALLLWATRRRLVIAEPATVALAGGLIVALIVPPLPARSGGGGAALGRRWLLNDPVGSTSVVLASDGALEREVRFTPFGSVYQESGQAVRSSFAGHRLAEGIGFFYMKARWYNPVSGTFLSVDPLVPNPGDPQSYNAYAYARNNPLSFRDPDGTSFMETITVWGSPMSAPPDFTSYYPTLIDAVAGFFSSGQAHVVRASLEGTGAGLGRPAVLVQVNQLADRREYVYEPDRSSQSGFGGAGPSCVGESCVDFSTLPNVNPIKLGVGGVNVVRGLTGLAAGTVTLGTSAGASTVVGPLALPGTAVGTAQLAFGFANLNRGTQQVREALEGSDPSLRNFLGLLPFGQEFDDPVEPLPQDFAGQRLRGLVQSPLATTRRLFREFFAFGPAEGGGP